MNLQAIFMYLFLNISYRIFIHMSESEVPTDQLQIPYELFVLLRCTQNSFSGLTLLHLLNIDFGAIL